jgi:hypothetical protein
MRACARLLAPGLGVGGRCVEYHGLSTSAHLEPLETRRSFTWLSPIENVSAYKSGCGGLSGDISAGCERWVVLGLQV